MNQPKVFEYMAVFHPTEEEIKAGKTSKILIPPTLVLAESSEDAEARAALGIPDAIKVEGFLLLIHEWGK